MLVWNVSMVAISDEIRAKVIAELVSGGAVNATARKYKLSPATVSRLKNEIAPQALKQLETEKHIRSVTGKQIQAVCEKYWIKPHFITSVVG